VTKPIVFKKSKGKGLLTNISIEEVSFCVKGANPGAKINLFKSKRITKEAATFSELFVDPEVAEAKNKASNSFFDMLDALSSSIHRIAFDSEITAKQRKEMMDKSMNEFTSIFKDKLRDDLTKAKAKGEVPMTYEDLIKFLGLKEVTPEMEKTLKALVDGASDTEETAKKVAELQKELEEAKKTKEEPKGDPKEEDPIAKAKAEGASEAVIKLLEEAKKDKDELAKKVEAGDQRIDKMEEQNLRKGCMEKANNLTHIEKADVLSDILYDLKKVATPELYGKVEKLLESAQAKLKESKLFKTVGSDEEEPTDSAGIEKKAEAMAMEKVAKDTTGMTKEQALADVWRENPTLQKEYEDAKAVEVRNR